VITAPRHQIAPRRLTRHWAGLGATALAAILIAAPKPAFAFDIGGLIGTAMALQMGGLQFGAPYRHGRVHVASTHHERDTGDRDRDTSGGRERDARDSDARDGGGGAKSDNRVASHHPAYGATGAAQASERDASAGQVASSAKTFDDAPAYRPSR